MYINRLQLENIRSFKELKINLSKHINLITGPNNSGKSTIIKSLYKLQDLNSLNADDIRKGENRAGILYEFVDVDDNDFFSLTKKDRDPLIKIEPTISVLYDLYGSNIKSNYFINRSGLDFDNARKKNSEGLNKHEFKQLPKKENQNNFIYPFFSKRKTNFYSPQGGLEDTYSVLEDLRNLPSKIQKIGNPTHFRNDEFRQYCNDILGFSVGVIPIREKENTIGIYAKDDAPIPIDSMGEGVANIIGLITILLTYDNKLFLIEELENDIHPQALKKLLNLIIEKAEFNQFIISTHSNIVLKYLGSLPETKIFYSEWEPFESDRRYGYTIPTSYLREIENTPNERLKILDKLGYDLFDYDVFKAYLIFEESSAERIVKGFVIPTFFPHLKDRIRTIAAQGTSDVLPKFNDLLRLFMYIHTSNIYQNRAWVICDGDESGIETIGRLKTKFSTWGESHFITLKEKNFESYYPKRFSPNVQEVLSLPHGQKKQDKKKELLNLVLLFIENDAENAKREFSESAKEIISRIEDISQQISKAI